MIDLRKIEGSPLQLSDDVTPERAGIVNGCARINGELNDAQTHQVTASRCHELREKHSR